ncbi:MAG: response regulator transcription factor [Candidatus Eisenbacteria bacterium]|nr:response regulator transcription factor [Candidatus Eisenbacteria bacterium]
MSGKGRRVLVVDDEEAVRELIELYLRKEGFEVLHAQDGKEALRLNGEQHPDLVILDLMLPGLDGWEVCRQIRSTSKVPILMLTARAEEVDRIVGLELGADDYVVKPFSPRELVARVKAILRRGTSAAEESEFLTFPGLRIDRVQHRVQVDDEDVHLTPTEFRLLWCLASRPARVFSRAELLDRIWGYDSESDARTVDVHIKRLRQKTKASESSTFAITTVWGLGYKFETLPGVSDAPAREAAERTDDA